MTTIPTLFPDPWSDRIRRLALAAKVMRQTPVDKRSPQWRSDWHATNRELAKALREVEG